LTLFALEGFLDRLARSSRADDMVLKGGVLLAAYDTRRPTRDLDFQVKAVANEANTVLGVVREIASMELDDGLVFDTAGATAESIREDDEYAGVRVGMSCGLATARLHLHVDVNVGDPVWPAPEPVEVPRLLGGTITVHGYPLTMVHAEKIATAVQRGTANTRWRDFADVFELCGRHDIEGRELERSLRTVAKYRQVTLRPLSEVLDGYAVTAQTRWAGWVRRQQLVGRLPREFDKVLDAVGAFADPALRGEIGNQRWRSVGRRWTS
jgi:hypothetical protein